MSDMSASFQVEITFDFEEDSFANFLWEHLPRIGERHDILLKKGKGYKPFRIVDLLYMHDHVEQSVYPHYVTCIKVERIDEKK